MGMPGFITSLILLLINFVLALKLEKRLKLNVELELVILSILLLVSLFGLFGVYKNKKWGWPLITILFALNGANHVWIYSNLSTSLTLWSGVLVNLFGLLVGILGIETYIPDEAEELETYDDEPKMKTTKKSSKKKNKKK